METTQLVLLAVGGFIVLFVIIFSAIRAFKKPNAADNLSIEEEDSFPNVRDDDSEEIIEQAEPIEEKKIIHAKKSNHKQADFMMISIHAKPNAYFSDYSFLEALRSAGLEYGEHKIFHYDIDANQGMQRMFSLAQLNKPGTFDLDHVETMNCKGLLLFIDLYACQKPTLALDCMLETAYQLADDLDGIMYEGYNTPWQENTPEVLAQKIEHYLENNASMLDEIID